MQATGPQLALEMMLAITGMGQLVLRECGWPPILVLLVVGPGEDKVILAPGPPESHRSLFLLLIPRQFPDPRTTPMVPVLEPFEPLPMAPGRGPL